MIHMGTPEELAAIRLARFASGSMFTILYCGNCGAIEGEEAPPCCRKCGDSDEPVKLMVVIP